MAEKITILTPAPGEEEKFVEELSIVTQGAQGQTFLIHKEQKMSMDIEQLAKTVLETEAENEEQLNEVLSGSELTEEQIGTLIAAGRLINSIDESIGEDLRKSIGSTLYGITQKQEDEEDEEEDGKPFGEKKKKKKAKTAKEDKEGADEMADQDKVQYLKEDGSINLDVLPEELKSEIEKLSKENTEKDSAIEEVKKAHQALEAKIIRKELTERVSKEYPTLGDPEKIADTLQKAYAVSEEFGKELEEQYKASEARLAESALLHEAGTPGFSQKESTSYAQLEKLAKERAEKDGISIYEAMDKVGLENKALVQAIDAEQRSR